jgi:hypothetical protein
MRHIAHRHLCTEWYVVQSDMTNCKYLHSGRSCGPGILRRASQYLATDFPDCGGSPSLDGPRQRTASHHHRDPIRAINDGCPLLRAKVGRPSFDLGHVRVESAIGCIAEVAFRGCQVGF